MTVNTIKLDRDEDDHEVHTFITFEGNGDHHIAVFAFSRDKKMIDGQPLATSFRSCLKKQLINTG